MLRLYPIDDNGLINDSPATIDGVFTASDLIIGAALALALATISDQLERPRRDSTSDQLVVIDPYTNTSGTDTLLWANATQPTRSVVVFDSWDEMQRPDNYIWYKTTAKARNRSNQLPLGNPATTTERRWVVIALVVVFAPIFTFELVLTVSRQIMCGAFLVDHVEWARYLCSPSDYNL
jgi:hypothetical protein